MTSFSAISLLFLLVSMVLGAPTDSLDKRSSNNNCKSGFGLSPTNPSVCVICSFGYANSGGPYYCHPCLRNTYSTRGGSNGCSSCYSPKFLATAVIANVLVGVGCCLRPGCGPGFLPGDGTYSGSDPPGKKA